MRAGEANDSAARRAVDGDRTMPRGIPLSSLSGGAGGSVEKRRRSRHPTVHRRAHAADRPVAFGYVRWRPGAGASVPVAAGISSLESFARSRGWEPGEVFLDDDPARPLLAWANLMATARGPTVGAVLVPDVPGLRPATVVLERLRMRCVREVGAPLLLVPPVLASEPSPGFAPRAGGRGGRER